MPTDPLRPTFLSDVLVGEEEDDLFVLLAQLLIKDLEIFPHRRLVVASTQGDLKHLALGRERREATDALFAAAPHSHEEGVTLRHAEDAMDAGQVVKGIVKQHHLHRGVVLIIVLQNL